MIQTSEILSLLDSHAFHFQSEADLQLGIERVLKDASIEFKREVRLTDADRIDFMVGTIGIEAKIDGSLSDVTRQLHRYAQLNEIESLILVTTRARHAECSNWVNRKKIEVYFASFRRSF